MIRWLRSLLGRRHRVDRDSHVDVWWTPDCGYMHLARNPVTIPFHCPDGYHDARVADEITRAALAADDSPSEGLPERIEGLRRLRLTGAQLDSLTFADNVPENHDDGFVVDWDEYDEFVLLDDVRAALTDPSRG